ncbi:hypothetical protein R6Q59_001523 [Mikania micrantha]
MKTNDRDRCRWGYTMTMGNDYRFGKVEHDAHGVDTPKDLRSQHSVESMSDKSILENKSKHPTYNKLVDEVETLKETCATMQQILIEKNIMSPLPKTRGPSQDDTSQCDENVDEKLVRMRVVESHSIRMCSIGRMKGTCEWVVPFGYKLIWSSTSSLAWSHSATCIPPIRLIRNRTDAGPHGWV